MLTMLKERLSRVDWKAALCTFLFALLAGLLGTTPELARAAVPIDTDQTIHVLNMEDDPSPTLKGKEEASVVKKTMVNMGNHLYTHPFVAMALVSSAVSIVGLRIRNLRRWQTRKRSRGT